MIAADIAVLGAGPAGAALACMLAPRHRVVLIDRQADPAARIGESLIPAARRLLRDMGLLDGLQAMGHAAYLGNRSYWGSGAAQETDFLRDPDGPGWHLDRPGFERFLRDSACQRGAQLLAPAKLVNLTRTASGWHLDLDQGQTVAARIVVDATGRAASVAKQLGARRVNHDRLTAHWLRGAVTAETPATVGFSLIECTPDGWWYSAPVPAPKPARVLAFHTDVDLGQGGDAASLVERALALPGIGPALRDTGFRATGATTTTAANTATLNPVAGDGWLAIGDAGLSFDPLASRGLFHALYSAMSAALSCTEALAGGDATHADYAADLDRVASTCRDQLQAVYGAETRWAAAPFWQRRGAAPAGDKILRVR